MKTLKDKEQEVVFNNLEIKSKCYDSKDVKKAVLEFENILKKSDEPYSTDMLLVFKEIFGDFKK